MDEGLGHLLKSSIQLGALHGLPLHNMPPSSHQKFVDDNMIMGYPSVQEARTLKYLLDSFSKTFGTKVNPNKLQILLFHTPPLSQRNVACILGFSIASLPSKYLGAPLTDMAIDHSSW